MKNFFKRLAPVVEPELDSEAQPQTLPQMLVDNYRRAQQDRTKDTK